MRQPPWMHIAYCHCIRTCLNAPWHGMAWHGTVDTLGMASNPSNEKDTQPNTNCPTQRNATQRNPIDLQNGPLPDFSQCSAPIVAGFLFICPLTYSERVPNPPFLSRFPITPPRLLASSSSSVIPSQIAHPSSLRHPPTHLILPTAASSFGPFHCVHTVVVCANSHSCLLLSRLEISALTSH